MAEGFSNKQQKRIDEAKGPLKARLRQQYRRQKALNESQRTKGGAAAPPPVPRAARRQRAATLPGLQMNGVYGMKAPNPYPLHRHLAAFSGFDKFHLPTDEQSAPYRVTNLINIMEFPTACDMDQIIVICPRTISDRELRLSVTTADPVRIPTADGPLCDIIAVRYNAATGVNDHQDYLGEYERAAFAGLIPEPASSFTTLSVRARIHNMSVKVECLGSDGGYYPSGNLYIGTVPMIEGGGSAEAPSGGVPNTSSNYYSMKNLWAQNAIQVGYLRSHSAHSLLDGKVFHSTVAENVTYKKWHDVIVQAQNMKEGAFPFQMSMEPIVIYVPRAGTSAVQMRYKLTIGTQWCTRHPTDVLLRAGQEHHEPSHPHDWNSAIQNVRNFSQGVIGNVTSAVDHYNSSGGAFGAMKRGGGMGKTFSNLANFANKPSVGGAFGLAADAFLLAE